MSAHNELIDVWMFHSPTVFFGFIKNSNKYVSFVPRYNYEISEVKDNRHRNFRWCVQTKKLYPMLKILKILELDKY